MDVETKWVFRMKQVKRENEGLNLQATRSSILERRVPRG